MTKHIMMEKKSISILKELGEYIIIVSLAHYNDWFFLYIIVYAPMELSFAQGTTTFHQVNGQKRVSLN